MAGTKRTQPVKSTIQLNAEYGKMPPQAAELEEVVLGALMLEKNAAIDVMDILKAEAFYNEAHRKIYEAIVSLSSNYQPVDILTVTEELTKKGQLEEVGGRFYITQLTNRVASAAHLEFHARIIAQKFIQRELIRVATEIQNKAYDPAIDVDDLLNFSEKELFNLAYGNIKKETARIETLVKEAIAKIEEMSQREDSLSGVPSGYTSLDRVTSGWQRSDLVIIAARPSMGKTSFVLSMMRNMAVMYKRPVAMFSLEMSSLQLVNRLIIAETELSSEKIKSGKLDYKVKNLVEAQIFIDDTPAINLFELRAKCRRLKMQYNIEMIIIDYLQLMTGPAETRGNREQEVSNISRGLKAIAKELDVPVIALSQLNRSVEMRSGEKRPQLSDLRESGAIEQDADIVIFIHRPEKYGLTTDPNGNSNKGVADIIIAKHRNGQVTDVRLHFIEHLAKFVEYEEDGLMTSFSNDMSNGSFTIGSKMNNDTFDDDKFAPNMGFSYDSTPF